MAARRWLGSVHHLTLLWNGYGASQGQGRPCEEELAASHANASVLRPRLCDDSVTRPRNKFEARRISKHLQRRAMPSQILARWPAIEHAEPRQRQKQLFNSTLNF